MSKSRTIIVFSIALITLFSCATVQHGYYKFNGELNSEDEYLNAWKNVLDWSPLDGNKLEILENGDAAFPAMLNAIAEAKDHIHFETYLLYGHNPIGQKFINALCEKAKQGVEVRFLVDHVGSRLSSAQKRQMTKCGVRWVQFNRFNLFKPLKSNLRTHRKILVIDGKLAFTGGMGFGSEWEGNADSPNHWRDIQVRIEGPVVSQLQELFSTNWEKSTGERIKGERYFPPLEPKGDIRCGTVGKWLENGKNKIREMWLLPLATAKSYYYMAIGYFLPDPDTMKALTEAANRGVDVKIIVPGEWTDLYGVRYAAMRHYGKLLKAGIKIYEYQGTNIHAKYAVADDFWTTVGSANFTNRTFNYLYENNLVCFDKNFALEIKALFEKDLSRSKKITLDDWENRPIYNKFFEEFFGIFEGWM